MLIQGEQALNSALPFALPVSSTIGGVGNISNYLGNLRHIPGTHSYGALGLAVTSFLPFVWWIPLMDLIKLNFFWVLERRGI
ncbi:hypothetical protein [Mycobacterium tuberculosis]|uniref:hypothetical protein n=1 Tax=Mycobacterium tuberculosis TaxID=1773 RepID=UPI00272BD39E|nr:hypothetical protein [Mycobacterium tuberculosis]